MNDGAPSFLTVALILCGACAAGCISATRWTDVHLRDTERVDVDAPKDARVARTRDDVLVEGRSVLDDGSWRARRSPGVVRRVKDAPDALHLNDGRYAWNRGDARLSTTRDNVAGAQVATMWTQPWGLLPSMGAIVGGGVMLVGFGVAGGALLVDAARTGDAESLYGGLAFAGGAFAGAALATYGGVTWWLVQRSPFYEPLPVVDDDARMR